jgi:hypothetical protein
MHSNNSSNHNILFNVPTPINNGRTPRTQRNYVERRRRRNRRQRNLNRAISRSQIHQDTLRFIINLPPQIITNDPLVDFLFQGSSSLTY